VVSRQIQQANLPTPETTIVVLLGASKYPRFPEEMNDPETSQAFRNSMDGVATYFRQEFCLPEENLLDLFDSDEEPSAIDDRIDAFLKDRMQRQEIRDVLVYYIGHGEGIGREDQLGLFVVKTRASNISASCIRLSDLNHTLWSNARFSRRIYILDCCYAGKALRSISQGNISNLISHAILTKGVLAFCSSGQQKRSFLGSNYTRFTEAILHVLRAGEATRPKLLSFQDVRDLVLQYFRENYPETPYPELHDPIQEGGSISSLPFFPNKQSKYVSSQGWLESSFSSRSMKGQQPVIKIEKTSEQGASRELKLDKSTQSVEPNMGPASTSKVFSSQAVQTWKLSFREESHRMEHFTTLTPGKICIITNQKCYAIDAHTGESQWTLSSTNYITYLQETDDGLIFISTNSTNLDKKIYAIDVAQGKLLWSLDILSWLRSEISILGQVDDVADRDQGFIYISTSKRKVNAIDRTTGKLHWTFDADEALSSLSDLSSHKVDNLIYIVAGPYNRPNILYAIDGTTGEQYWSFDGNRDLVSFSRTQFASDIVNKCLYIVGHNCDRPSEGDVLYAIDIQTGKLRWFFKDGITSIVFPPRRHQDIIYIVSRKKKVGDTLIAIQAATGEISWKFAGRSKILYPLVITNTLTFAAFKYSNDLEMTYILDNVNGEIVRIANQLYSNWLNLLAFKQPRQTSDKIAFAPAMIKDSIYVAMNSLYLDRFEHYWHRHSIRKSKLYSIDAVTGKQHWEFKTTKIIPFPPKVINGHVYIMAFSLSYDQKSTYPEAVEGEVIMRTSYYADEKNPHYYAGTLYILDEKTGKELWTLDTKGTDTITLFPKIANGYLYFGTARATTPITRYEGTAYIYDNSFFAFSLPE
jgi:outer membrane protein assembly factor BamB